jgi:uncharacterized damage-inducible protein DinB
MNGVNAVRAALDQSQLCVTALVADVQDSPLTFPTSKGGNHPLWALGHITHSEASLLAGFVLGEANPLAKWDELFGMGSEPVADTSQYPSLGEVQAEFEKVRGRTLQWLDSCGDADLSRRSRAPEEHKDMFGTVGQCLIAAAMHAMFHAGQIADARRVMGRKPVFG